MNDGLGMLIMFLIEEKINEGRFAQNYSQKNERAGIDSKTAERCFAHTVLAEILCLPTR